MHHIIAIASSLTSLGLVAAIYYCNTQSSPSSRLRSEMTSMTLLSMIAGFVPMAIACTIMALWKMMEGGLSFADIGAASAVLASVAALVATEILFRKAIRATSAAERTPDGFTPLTPRPVNSGHKPASIKLAA